MFENHVIELLTPRQNREDLESALERFAAKYEQGLESGYVLSVPDNPMGMLRFQMTEVMSELGLRVVPERLILHINSFHTKPDLDRILAAADELDVTYLLIVSGDGGQRLPRLDPQSLGSAAKNVTAVELLEYIGREHGDRFVAGVAFNPYEPLDHEIQKFERKIEAGAQFAVTQPVTRYEPGVGRLQRFRIPVVVGAWMSANTDLLAQCVGYPLPNLAGYDPLENLESLQQFYPGSPFYLSVLDFKRQLPFLSKLLWRPGQTLGHPSLDLDPCPAHAAARDDTLQETCYTLCA